MTQQCERCRNTATRNLGEKRDGPTHVCEIHAALTDPRRRQRSERKIGLSIEDVPRCKRCGTRALNKRGTTPRLLSHHVCYGHDTTVELCSLCHSEVHNDPDDDLHPHDTKLSRGVADDSRSGYPEKCQYVGVLE